MLGINKCMTKTLWYLCFFQQNLGGNMFEMKK